MRLRATWVWREPHRALVAVLIVMLGCTGLRIALAIDSGLERLCHPRRSQPCLCVFERYHEGAASQLPTTFADEIARLPGVIGVLGETWAARDALTTFEQAPIRVTELRHLDRLGDHFAGSINSIREGFEQRETGVTMFDPATGRPRFSAVVGRNFARRARLEKGDFLTVNISGGGVLDLFIVEVVDGRGTIDDVSLFVENNALDRLGRDPAVHTMYWVKLAPDRDPQSLIDTIERLSQRLPPQVTVLPEPVFIAERVAPVRDIVQVGQLIVALGLVVTVSLVCPLLLVALSARLKEIGSVLLIGVSPRRLIGAVLREAAVIGILGGVAAMGLSRWMVATWIPGVGIGEVFVPVSLYLSRDFLMLGAAVLLTLVAARWPARWAVRHAIDLHFPH